MASPVVRVAVAGASGYAGAELLRLLAGHSAFRVVHLSAQRAAGSELAAVFPHLGSSGFGAVAEMSVEGLIASGAELLFSALPHGQSAAVIAQLLEAGVRVVDLSADFRLRDASVYGEWYGSHPHPELCESAVYGLPERYRAEIANGRLVAAPGCYPTATLLAALPLVSAGLIEASGLIVDAKSGVSGAGRVAKQSTSFAEVGEGLRAYGVAGTHRHTPEIEQEVSLAAGKPSRLVFTPHLVPMSRGIFACVYGKPTKPGIALAEYREALDTSYANEPFVTMLDAETLPDTAWVRGSNHAQVAVRVDARTDTVLAFCAIDNLVKGAAGQALQCANLMCGLEETTGLGALALFP